MKIWNNLSKRGLALFLVLTMCVSLLPATALATELEELNHIHNEDGWVCEEAQGDLTCDIEEHRHSDECYAPGEPVLSCALTEDEGHTHGDSCYSEEENLTLACGLEEGEGHAHDEACFTGGEGVLVCETAEHTHGGECYEAVWSCASPSKNIQRFLRAVRDIPEEITAADEGAVIAARQAYDLLTEDELLNPAVVVGLVTLEHAETVLDAVEAETDEPGEGDETLEPKEPGLDEPGEEEPTEPETPELVIPEDATVVTPDLLLKAAYGQTMSVESFFGLVQSSKTVGENPPATLTFVGEGLETVFLYEEAAAYTEQITVEEYAILLDGAEATVYAQGEAEAAGGSNALADVADTTITMMVGEKLDVTTINKKGTWQDSFWFSSTDKGIATLNKNTLTGVGVGSTQIWWKEKGTSGNATTYTVVVTEAQDVIRFDANKGSGSVEEIPFDKRGDAVTLPSGAGLSRPDYEFLGWAERPDVNTVSSNTTSADLTIYGPGDEYVTNKTGVITLYAVWAQVSGTCNGNLTVAVRSDGVAPSEPAIINDQKYYYLTPNGGLSTNILNYVNPAHTVAGVDAVKGRLTSTFYEYVEANSDKVPGFNPDTQYIEWYVIKYQNNNGGEWHVDGTVKDRAKVSLYYNGNGSTDGLAPDGREYVAGTSVTVEWRDGLVKRGYNFNSWNTKRDGSGDSYEVGDTITLTKNTTLYAQWEPNDGTEYTVEYYLEGSDGMYPATASSSDTKTAITGSTVTATAKQIDGFTFDSENSGNVRSGTVAADGSLTLKLYYKRNLYTVTYDPNGGTSTSTEMMFENLKYGAATPTIAEPTREGYTFTGWTPEVAGTVTGDVTYVAQWEEDTTATKELSYTVEYYKNGAIQTEDTQTETATVQVLEPDTMTVDRNKINTTDKYDGYVFEKTEPAVIPTTIDNGGVIKVYYVQKFKVTYTDGESGTVFEDQVYNVKFGDQIPAFTGDTTRTDGYKFNGWDPEVSTGTVTKDLTYTAKWIPDPAQTKEFSYTVEYYKDGVKEGEPETITETVQFLETQVPVDASKINTTDKFETPAYRFDEVKINDTPVVGALPTTVAPGTTIKVYYVSNTAAYTVEYYYGATESTVEGNAPTLYADAADGAYITYAAPAGDTAVIGTDVTVTPARFVKVDGTCYVLWKVEPVTIQADPAPNAVKVHYLADTDGDGMPDAFQSKATYHVTGGSWSTGENVPEKTQVLTFKTWNEASEAWVDTFPAPAFETSLPIANSDCDPKSGKWDENDLVQVSERPEMGKTYTFHYSFDLMYGYTVRYHFVDKNRQPVQGCERENANEKDRLDAGQSYVAAGTVVELSKLPKVVTFDSGGSTKKFVIVSGNTDRTVQRKTGGNPNVNVFDVYYGVDEIGTNGPDDVADCFQATVTYTATHGTVSFETAVVTLLTNGQPAVDGTGYLTALQIPAATPSTGYNAGTETWTAAKPTTGTAIKGDVEFKVTWDPRNDLCYTVNYLEKVTDDKGAVTYRPIDGVPSKTVDGQTFQSTITAAGLATNIRGFRYDSADPETLTITVAEGQDENANNVINLYYIRSNYSYTVEYYFDTAESSEWQSLGTVSFEGTLDAEMTYWSDLTDKDNAPQGIDLSKLVGNYAVAKVERTNNGIITENAEDNIVEVYFGIDKLGGNNGDGTADRYQATVTFAVVGGSWNHGSTGAPLVVMLTNPQGELDENGSYTLADTDDIPGAGQNPDDTHRAAKDTDTNLWAPALSTPVTKDNHAFTYTYPSKNTMTVTVEGIDRPYNGKADAISVTVTDGGTALADAVIKYYSDAAYEKEITSFNNSFKDVADSTTIYIRVTHPDYTAVDTRAVVAITPVAVTVTADSKEMVYGGEMPKLTATVSGILTGEEGELAYKLDCAAGSSNVGEYAITVTGKQLNNYDVSYVSGTLTIKGQVFYKENAPRATDVTGMPERPTERHKVYKLGEEVPHTDLSTKVPVRKGYTFAGWSLASGEDNKVLTDTDEVIMGETGVTLYAVWTQNTYTVKVNYRLTENGKDLKDYTNHTLPTSKDVGYPNGWSVALTPDATITALENIVVDGEEYVLDGSLSSETLSGVAPKYEGPGTSVEVTLVYALDSNGNTTPDYLERFSLTYDANGGEGKAPADETEYAQYDKATLVEPTSLSKDKAVFIGWSLTKHEELITSKEAAGGAGIVSDVTFALADITVYAVWAEDENENNTPDYEEDRFTVTYTDGVDGAEIFEDQVYEDVLVDMPTPAFDGTPRRTGYTFTGWDPAVAGTVTADAAYTAQWRRNTYTITIEVINGTSNPEGSVTVSYNGSTTIHFSGNPGYELGFVTVDGKPAALANSAYTFSNVDRNHKIQVLYTQSTFTVTFVDGLTGETIEVRAGLVELPGEGAYPAAPAHEGYELTSWTVGAPDANGNVTITANYKPIEVEEETFTVTFVDGLTGETIEVRAGLVELPGEGTYPAAPEHEGYEFTGWTVGAPDADGNVTITANYKPIEVEEETFTVTFVDGLTGETIEVRTGLVELPGEGTYPAAPAHEGYEFTGWTVGAPDANGNVVITANYKPAEVEEDTYTVTWLNWNGVQLQQKVVKKGDPEPSYTGLPPTRLSDGVFSYTFIGWSAPSVDADGNVTYTAQYTATRIPVDPGPGPGPGPGSNPGPGPGGGDVTIPDNDPPLAGGDGTVTINDQEVPLAGAIGLNSVDHFAYIIGYDDDTVRPLNNITRAEVATIFFRLMTEDYRNANWATANDFSDVTAGSWFNNAVSTCANAGLLTGYPDGTFKPNQSITRAEFAAVAARFLSNEYTGENVGDFFDTKGHWAAKEIRRAAEAGWVTGSNNGFRPNDKINRAEVMTIVNRMLDRIPDAEHMLGTMKKWKDNPEDAWYYEAVQEATNEHAYERDELGVTEHWTEVLPASDWKNLEAAWANANTGKADEADESTEPTESAETVETVAP